MIPTALSSIAILVSIVVAVAQYRQKKKQAAVDNAIRGRLADIEEGRRKDEQRPEISLNYVFDPDGASENLEWTNHGPHDLDDVHFELIERSGAGWRPLVGVRFHRESWTCQEQSLGPMKVGEPVAHGIVRTPGSEHVGGTARFRMLCTAGEENWKFALACKIPPTP